MVSNNVQRGNVTDELALQCLMYRGGGGIHLSIAV